jgi:hypothetical protein
MLPVGGRRLVEVLCAVAAVAIAYVVGTGLTGSGPLSALQELRSPRTAAASAGDDGGTFPSTPGTTDRVGTLAAHTYRPGDCVTWQQDGHRDEKIPDVVPCDQPHLVEVVKTVTLSHPPDHYPTEEDWRSIATSDCAGPAQDFFGAPIDENGRFWVDSIRTGVGGWVNGDRSIVCVIGLVGTTPGFDPDHLTTFAFEVKGQPQALVYPPGTCVDTSGPGVVACSAPHTGEVVGSVDLTGKASVMPADKVAWRALVGDDCTRLATSYLGHPLVAPVYATWYPMEASSWDVGTRTVMCVLATDQAGTVAQTTGSMKGP